MNYVFSLYDSRFLKYTNGLSPAEIIIYPYRFTKYGKITLTELSDCLVQLKSTGHRVVICADILLKEMYLNEFKSFLNHPAVALADAFRFMDPGIGNLFRKKFPDIPLQQSLERHSLNQSAVKSWFNVFEQAQERLILSTQLPLDKIEQYSTAQSPEFELLGIGLIEIFYSARNLLNPDSQTYFEERGVKNEERPGPLSSKMIQTTAGTVMFYERLLYIADMVNEIEKAGIRHLRFDFWDCRQWELYLSIRQPDNSPDHNQKELWGKTTRAFIKVNKTDAQFKRLNNENLRNFPNKLGRVLEYNKPNYLAVEITADVYLPANIRFITPEGRKLNTRWEALKNIQGVRFQSITPGIYLTPWLKYALPGSYFKKEEDDN